VMDVYPLVGGSDQWSFLQVGYPAVLVSEGFESGDFNPYYHTVSDAVSVMDLSYYADLTRASIATLAHLGHILPGDGVGRISGTVYDSRTGRPVSPAAVVAFWPVYHYTFTAATDEGGVYVMTLPAGEYVLTVRSAFSAAVTEVTILPDAVVTCDVALGSAGAVASEGPVSEKQAVLSVDSVLDLIAPARVFVLLIYYVWRVVGACLGF
jgi:hypothetical protein